MEFDIAYCERCGKTIMVIVKGNCFIYPTPKPYLCSECIHKEIEELLKQIRGS